MSVCMPYVRCVSMCTMYLVCVCVCVSVCCTHAWVCVCALERKWHILQERKASQGNNCCETKQNNTLKIAVTITCRPMLFLSLPLPLPLSLSFFLSLSPPPHTPHCSESDPYQYGSVLLGRMFVCTDLEFHFWDMGPQ